LNEVSLYRKERSTMKKRLFLLIFVVLALTSFSAFTSSAGSNSLQSSDDSALTNDTIFTIPIGDNGIHYADEDGPELLRWGPTAIAIAPDGSFWIADAPDDRLLHFSKKGELIDKISTIDFVTGVYDLEVTSKDIWVLDGVSRPPKIVQLSIDGKLLNFYDLPKGLRREDGLTGIALGIDGSILVELGEGYTINKFITETGEVVAEAIES
jgi:hypothetical protein